MAPSGGTPPYSINWTPGNLTTPTISDLCAGEYILTLTDTNGCTVVDTFNIIEPPVLTASISNTVQVLCDGACAGEATVDPMAELLHTPTCGLQVLKLGRPQLGCA